MHCAIWTDQEDELIKARRIARVPVPKFYGELDGRTKEAVYARAAKLRVFVMERRPWTKADVKLLRQRIRAGDSVGLAAQALDRHEGSVRWKMDELDIRSAIPCVRWTAEQKDALVRMHGEDATHKAMAKATGRTVPAVKEKLRQMGLGGGRAVWDDVADQALREAIADGLDAAGCAAELRRGVGAVRARAAKIGERFAPHGTGWTGDDDGILTDALAVSDIAAASSALGRTERACLLRATKIGLREKSGPRHLDEAAKVRIAEAALRLTITAAAAELGHDIRTLKLVAGEKGFEFRQRRRAYAGAPRKRTGAKRPFERKALPAVQAPPSVPCAAKADVVRRESSPEAKAFAMRFLKYREKLSARA